MLDRRFLLIQRMKMYISEYAFDTGHSGFRDQLIRIRRINNKCLAAVFVRKCLGDLRSQLCRMLYTVGPAYSLIVQDIVDPVYAAVNRHKAAASSYNSIQIRQIHAVCLDQVTDHAQTEGKLIGNGFILCKFVCCVGHILGKQFFLAFINGDLG